MVETWLLGLSAFAWNWSVYTFFGAIPPFLFSVNYSPLEVGLVALVFGVAAFFGAAIGGGFGDHWTRKSRDILPTRIRMILTSYIVAMVGWIFLLALGAEQLIIVMLATILVSFGVNAAVTHIYALTTRVYPARLVAVGAGFVGFVGTIPAPMAAQVSIFTASNLGWTYAWIIALVLLGTAGLISPSILATKKKPLLRRLSEVERLYGKYLVRLRNIKKDWELNRAELYRELNVLKKSISDSQEALDELHVLHQLEEINSQEYGRRKAELEGGVKYLKEQAAFIESAITRIEFIASRHLFESEPTAAPAGREIQPEAPSPVAMAIREKLAKLEAMHKAGRIQSGLYQRLKEDYYRKMKQAAKV